MKILVTGAGGFIGSHLAANFARHHEVAAPDRRTLDLLDFEAVTQYLRRHAFDVVVHAATARATREARAAAGIIRNHALRMFLNMASNSEAYGRMLFLSSGAVYDRARPMHLVSEDQFGERMPGDEYGFAKFRCGRLIQRAHNIWDLRPFGVFGPHEDWETRFVSNSCCRAMWDLPIVVRRNAFFDYMSVTDLVSVVECFLTARTRHRAYNICTARPVTLASVAELIGNVSGQHLTVRVTGEELGPEYSGSNRRLLDEFPFSFRPLEQSLDALYRWYLDRKQTIDPLRLRPAA